MIGGDEPQARAATQKALELDDRLAEAYVAEGRLQFFYDWDWRSGENRFRRALELDPNSLDAHFNYGPFSNQGDCIQYINTGQ